MITIEVILHLIKCFAVGLISTIIGALLMVVLLFSLVTIFEFCEEYIESLVITIKGIGACGLLIIVITILGSVIVSDMGW